MHHCSLAAPHIMVDSCLSDVFHGLLTCFILLVILVFTYFFLFVCYLQSIDMLLSRGWDDLAARDLAACISFSSSSCCYSCYCCCCACVEPPPPSGFLLLQRACRMPESRLAAQPHAPFTQQRLFLSLCKREAKKIK